MWPRIDGLRALELGSPGEMRDWLNGLVLTGEKCATAGLVELDYRSESEDLEHPGERLILLDNDGAGIAEVEIAAIEVVPFGDVTWEFAQAEGEGFRSIEHWREAHARFWAGEGHEVDDASEVACIHFRLVITRGRER